MCYFRQFHETLSSSTNQVLELLDVSQSTLAKMKREHDFPHPIPLTTKGYRYSSDDINEWLDSQKQKHIESNAPTELDIKLCQSKPKPQAKKLSLGELELMYGSNVVETANFV